MTLVGPAAPPGLALRARIHVPDLPPGTVQRRALLDRLDEALLRPPGLAMLAAPAGFGKTTLLAHWARHRLAASEPVAWLTATGRDADPAALFAAVRDALALGLEGTAPEVSTQLLELALPADDEVTAWLDPLLMVLDDLVAPLTLVIDDLHTIGEDAALTLVEALALGIPPTVRLALAGRGEPRRLLTSLRLRADVLELGAAELALSAGEVHAIVQAGGEAATLGEDLFRQTEGWPAAVRLGVLAARTGRLGEGLALPLTYDPSVADFLTREIEAALPAEALALLRDTAVVSELSPRLAAALSGRPDAGDILEDLFRAQALVRRAGTTEPVYLVHGLLRSHLLAALSAADVHAPARQHAAAARFLAAQGLSDQALEHARAAGEPALSAQLLAAFGARLLTTGRASALLDSLATVPASHWDADLAALATLARAELGDLPGAQRALSLADRIVAAAAPPGADVATTSDSELDGVPSLRRVAQFVLRRLQGQPDDPAFRATFADLLAWQPDLTPPAEALDRQLLLLVDRGQWSFATGRYDAAWADLHLALDLASIHRRDRIELRSLSTLAALPAMAGQAAATDRYVADILDRIEVRGWAAHPSMANVYAAASWAASLMLLPQRAEQMIERAHQALAGTADPEYATYTAVADAALQADRAGEPTAAMALLARLAQGGPAGELTPSLRTFAGMQRIRITLRRGDLAGADEAVADLQRWAPGTADPEIGRAQVLAARGMWAQCRATLRRVDELRLPITVPVYQVVRPMLEALACQRLGQDAAARLALVRALDVAAPRGVIRPFWEAGPTMRAMLVGLRGRLAEHDDFADTILARWEAADRLALGPVAGVDAGGIALTRRELEVLRELPTLMTAEELAAAQQVSVNTIRTHMRALYRKLGVRTRRDAVRRGRELGLV